MFYDGIKLVSGGFLGRERGQREGGGGGFLGCGLGLHGFRVFVFEIFLLGKDSVDWVELVSDVFHSDGEELTVFAEFWVLVFWRLAAVDTYLGPFQRLIHIVVAE